jgi:FAD-dependent urate hydroxylase
MSSRRESSSAAADAALSRLTETVRYELDCLDYPARPWVRPRRQDSGEAVLDVVIVGGGQSGLGAAFGLMREHIENILVIDENREGQEGPWITYARMVTLRTPKYLTGPDLGIPSLTFRVWWETQFGRASWEKLDKIPREDWMRYLRWYRATLRIPVRNECRLTLIEPLDHHLFRLHVTGAGAPVTETLLARKVVLATGIQGGGEWHVPPFIAEKLPKSRYAHTSEPIDFAALRGRRIGILGGGASAFDNAQHGLRAGVGEMHVFIRRKELPRVNPIRYIENAGFLGHFAALDDAAKYAAISHFLRLNQPPTNDTFNRAASYPGFRLHLGAPWLAVAETADGVAVTTQGAAHLFDFVVLSTGLLTDAKLRPELALVADDIALWKDRYKAPPGEANPLVDQHPYLGPAFELTPRKPAAADRLYGLFALNYSALASLGLSASALSGMKFALPRLVQGIARQLFLDDSKAILRDYYAYNEEEFAGQWSAG